MKVIRCDRCGKEEKLDAGNVSTFSEIGKFNPMSCDGKQYFYDLCVDCECAFQDWVEMREEKERGDV